MADFFERLTARTFSQLHQLQPRLQSRFEETQPVGLEEIEEEIPASPTPSRPIITEAKNPLSPQTPDSFPQAARTPSPIVGEPQQEQSPQPGKGSPDPTTSTHLEPRRRAQLNLESLPPLRVTPEPPPQPPEEVAPKAQQPDASSNHSKPESSLPEPPASPLPEIEITAVAEHNPPEPKIIPIAQHPSTILGWMETLGAPEETSEQAAPSPPEIEPITHPALALQSPVIPTITPIQPPPPAPERVLEISIGSIIVQANTPSPPASQRSPEARLGLDDYLAKRSASR